MKRWPATKRIDRIKQNRNQLEKDCKQATSNACFCLEDARTAGEKLIRKACSSDHQIGIDTEEVPKYGRGRPAKNKPGQPARYEYVLRTTIKEAPEKVDPLRREAGCFVLLSNLLDQQAAWPAHELLSLYKSQIGIEQNFSFLKDPVIVIL